MNCILPVKGEKSRRLNRVKALTGFRGKTLLELALRRAENIFGKIYLVTTVPGIFKHYEDERVEILEDNFKCGPVGGIYAGLKESDTCYNFVLAVDNIFVSGDMILYMMSRRKNYDVLVPKSADGPQPLVGIYSKNIIKTLERRMGNKDYSLRGIFDEVDAAYMEEAEISRFGAPERLFFNINTAADLERSMLLREESY